MFTLPELSEIDAEITKERGLLSGSEFINSSGELSVTARQEVQEEIKFCTNRIEKFRLLHQVVATLEDMNYKERPNQFASEEVINEFKRLIGNATLVLNDFKPPLEIEIKVKEV